MTSTTLFSPNGADHNGFNVEKIDWRAERSDWEKVRPFFPGFATGSGGISLHDFIIGKYEIADARTKLLLSYAIAEQDREYRERMIDIETRGRERMGNHWPYRGENDDDPPDDDDPAGVNVDDPPQDDADEAPRDDEIQPTPVDIFGLLTVPEPDLTPDMLPELVRHFAVDTADRLGVTLATVAMPALAICAGALHGAIVIQPKRFDTCYIMPAILWAMGIGDPGMRKTQALNAAASPLEAVDQQWREEDHETIKRYERSMAIYKRQIADWDRLAAQGKAEGPEPEEPPRPPKRQAVTTDYTIEKLAEILEDNPRGTVIKIDELSFLYGSFDAYRAGKASKDRPAALELFDGGRRVIDRLGYTRVVPHWGASIVGNIQEDKLAKLARGLTDDGLMQRFLCYRVGKTGNGHDRTPDDMALARYQSLVGYLARREPTGRPVTLSEGAQVHREAVEQITEALASNPMVPPALRGHAAKLHGTFCRLLLTMHVIDYHLEADYSIFPSDANFDVITAETAKRCRDLFVRFVIPNSVRVYADYFDGNEAVNDGQWIAGHVLANKLDTITDRNIYKAAQHHPMANDDRRRSRAMAALVDSGWASVDSVRRRDSRSWLINPKVHVLFAERARQEAKLRKEIKDRISKAGETMRQAYA